MSMEAQMILADRQGNEQLMEWMRKGFHYPVTITLSNGIKLKADRAPARWEVVEDKQVDPRIKQ